MIDKTLPPYICNDRRTRLPLRSDPKRISKRVAYRFKAFLVKDKTLSLSQPYGDQAVPELLLKELCS